MGTFDPSSFLDLTVTDSNSTQATPVPVGEYPAVASEPEIRQWNSRDGTKSGLALDIIWDVDDAGVKSTLGRDKVTVKQGIMLDLNESGGLDTGKGRNVSLGRLREALGLNTPGVPFNFRMIAGRAAKIKVEHRVDGENIYADVKGVARLG
jgi:hypothetical protein